MKIQTLRSWSEAEYLAFERGQPQRHEYLAGDVVAMAGASRRHSLLVGNAFLKLAPLAAAKGCETHSQAMKVRIRQIRDTWYYYPDLVLSCDRSEDDDDCLSRPCLIVEVLSPSTAGIDQREKKRAYLSIPSLRQYLLIDQETAHIESLRRSEQGWIQELLGPGDSLRLECLDAELPFEGFYAGVDVPPPGSGASQPPHSP